MTSHLNPVPCDACGETIKLSDGYIECQNCLSVRHIDCPKDKACWEGYHCPGRTPEPTPPTFDDWYATWQAHKADIAQYGLMSEEAGASRRHQFEVWKQYKAAFDAGLVSA
jgi:hypothetical protein